MYIAEFLVRTRGNSVHPNEKRYKKLVTLYHLQLKFPEIITCCHMASWFNKNLAHFECSSFITLSKLLDSFPQNGFGPTKEAKVLLLCS